MSLSQTMVRMGELASSSASGHVLVSLGLGSCIGLALVDRRMGIAGLAHIVLPQSQGQGGTNPGKFADLAIPYLVGELEDLGARRVRLEAVLVGGASMFAVTAASLEVGQRNEAAVREQLERMRIRVAAAATGGNRGRTIRVDVGTATVTVREAGGKDTEVLAGSCAMEAVA
jgi:chemotaxis protein CheD